MKITIPLVLLVVNACSMALTGCCTLAKSDPAKTIRRVDLITDVLPFRRLWYDGPNAASNAIA